MFLALLPTTFATSDMDWSEMWRGLVVDLLESGTETILPVLVRESMHYLVSKIDKLQATSKPVFRYS